MIPVTCYLVCNNDIFTTSDFKEFSGYIVYCNVWFWSHISGFQDGDAVQELEECRLKVSHILQSSLMSDGSRRFATPPQQIAVYNKRIQPVQDEDAEPSPVWVYKDKDYIVGDEVENFPNLVVYP